MLPEMTPAVARALDSAQRCAVQLGAAEVLPLHLVAGLLEEEEGRAATLANDSGLDLTSFRRSLESQFSVDTSNPTPGLNLSQSSQRAFVEARRLGRNTSVDRSISGECLLLGVLRSDDDARRALERHGLDMARCESTLADEDGPSLELEEPLALVEVFERVGAARVFDASANRAGEAIRVLDDYARFCLDDAFLSSQLKQLRHDLAAAVEEVSPELLLESRDTLQDVGTAISTPSERERCSLSEVVRANSRRLQEALRSLEEFGKLLGPDLGARMEGLRYRAYTLERALTLGASARARLANCAVQVLLTGAHCLAALDWTIAEAAAGGATMFQLREKKLSDRDLLVRARNVRRWTQGVNTLFIVNDRPDIARLVEADGVHLGQDDMPVKEVRRIAGPDMLIGVSTHSVEQVRQAVLDGASYLGVGPTFPSATKEFGELAGVEFVRQATKETTLPLFVIGGVNAKTLPDAVAAGARRIAVSHAVCRAEDPRKSVAELLAILRG